MKVPPTAVINIIRENLNDRYRKGFPILKELIQNADDAAATELHVGWVESLGNVSHPLLGTPALFVANNGVFKSADGEAIDCIGLSSKTGSKYSVGKFGLGLKSIFHLCEAFFYVAADELTGEPIAHIVNPWADNQGKDEYHQEWENFSAGDQSIIRNYLSSILGEQPRFSLWIPLRRSEQLENKAPIMKDFPGDSLSPPQFLSDIAGDKVSLLLPFLKSLKQITVWLPDSDHKTARFFQINLGESARRSRFPQISGDETPLPLTGQIITKQLNGAHPVLEKYKFSGLERIWNVRELQWLKESNLWPISGTTDTESGDYIKNRDKAEPHCAICFNEYPANGKAYLSISLAVFLTVDEPAFSRIPLQTSNSNFSLTLHGYFFLDAGRSRIEGFDVEFLNEQPRDEQSLRFEWNARLFRNGTLRLLLPALEQFTKESKLSDAKIQTLTAALQQSDLVKNPVFLEAICSKFQWIYCVTSNGSRWRILNANDPVFEIPNPPVSDMNRPFIVFPVLKQFEYLTVREMPYISNVKRQPWNPNLLEMLKIDVQIVFENQGNLDYFLEFFEKYVLLPLTDETIIQKLINIAREAFSSIGIKQLSSYRSRIQRFVKLIPHEHRFVLRLGEKQEKSELIELVMSEMLQEDISSLWVPSRFDPTNDPSLDNIKAEEAISLLFRLNRFQLETDNDVLRNLKNAIAVKIINAIELHKDRERVLNSCASYPLFRGYDLSCKCDVSISFRELNDLSKQNTVFRFANPNANPKTEGEARRLQQSLRDARVLLITADVAHVLPGEIPTCTPRVCVDTLAKVPVLNSTEQRIDLLKSLSGQLNLDTPKNQRCLRYLLHHQSEYFENLSASLLVNDTDEAQSIWFRITDCVLQLKNADWRVVERVLIDNLTPIQQGKLNIETINHQGVESLLCTQPQFEAVNNQLNFTTEDCDILLREINSSDVLRRLKIHETLDGERVVIQDNAFLVTEPSLKPGVALSSQMVLLRCHNDKTLAEKQHQLVTDLTSETVLEIALHQPEPGKYWQDIMLSLADEYLQKTTLNLAKEKEWLPLAGEQFEQQSQDVVSRFSGSNSRANNFQFISPKAVIYWDELRDEVARLTSESKLFWDVTKLAPQLKKHPNFDKLSDYSIFPQKDEIIDMLGTLMEQNSHYWIGQIDEIQDAKALTKFQLVFNDAPPELMPACQIIKQIVKHSSPDATVEHLLPHIKKPIATERLIQSLQFLISEHKRVRKTEKHNVLDVFDWYLRYASKSNDFVSDILPEIMLLNQNDKWASPAELCNGVAGIDKSNSLHKRHARILPSTRYQEVDDDDSSSLTSSVRWPEGTREKQLSDSVNTLKEYFRPWEGTLNSREIIGGFLSFLGDHHEIIQLAEQYLGHRDVKYVRDMFQWEPLGSKLIGGGGEDVHKATSYQRFIIATITTETKHQTVVSVLGQPFDAVLQQESEISHLIAGDEHKKFSRIIEHGYQINHICLREINPEQHSPEQLSKFLKATTLWLLKDIYLQNVPNLERVWEELEQSEQLDIQLSQSLLLGSAFFYLRQLGLQTGECITVILQIWEDARRKEVQYEQLASMGREDPRGKKDIDQDKKTAKGKLRELIETDVETQKQILKAIRSKMAQYQYKRQSVPFELFQNADDAVVELDAILPQAEPTCVIIRKEGKLSFLHWGRPINEFRFGEFDGSNPKYGYDRDLEKMLILSYSDKMGSTTDVTGKFGLGFKSVFLICDQPRILSGRLGFKVFGGLYPVRVTGSDFAKLEEHVLRESPDRRIRGTLFELPLREGISAQDVMKDFERLAHITLAFSNRIRRLRLYTDSSTPVEIGWNEKPVTQTGHTCIGQLQLVNAHASAETAMMVKTEKGDVLILLGARGFKKFPEDVPTLWVTLPTQEMLDFGFVVNGQFHLDVGRAQLARESKHNLEWSEKIGDDFGKEFCRIFSLAEADWASFCASLNLATDVTEYDFWESLWELMGHEFYQRTTGNRKQEPGSDVGIQKYSFVSLLHNMIWGNQDKTRGYGHLIATHLALPTHLSGKYKILTSATKVAYATKGVLETSIKIDGETPAIFGEVSTWAAFNKKIVPSRIINGDIKRILGKLYPNKLKIQDITLSRVIDWEILNADKEYRLDAETSARLGALITPEFINELERTNLNDFEALRDEHGPLKQARFKALDGKYYLAKQLILLDDRTKNAGEDEARRASFAPDRRVLSEEYDIKAQQFFKACRGSMLARVKEELVEWALEAKTTSKREAVLRYLLEGEQNYYFRMMLTGDGLFQKRFKQSWLANADKLSIWQHFPEKEQNLLRQYLSIEEEIQLPPIIPHKDARETLMDIYEWWGAHREKYIKEYEKETYLNGFPQVTPEFDPNSKNERLPWLAFFMLGSFQTMGRQTSFQHRGFLQKCIEKNWMDVFAEPPDVETGKLNSDKWIKILEEYIIPKYGGDNTQDYHQWMKQFISIYQLARWLPDYVDLFLSTEQYSKQFTLTQLTSPQTNAVLQGGGIDAPKLSKTLGIGTNFVLRELVRNKIVASPIVYEHCYVPTKQIRDFFSGLGCNVNGNASVDTSKQIFNFISERIGNEKASFGLSFDLPFKYWLKLNGQTRIY